MSPVRIGDTSTMAVTAFGAQGKSIVAIRHEETVGLQMAVETETPYWPLWVAGRCCSFLGSRRRR